KKCAGDARKFNNRRNDMMHHVWGLHASGKAFEAQQMPPTKHAPRRVPLSQIEDLVYRIRMLAGTVIELTDELWHDPNFAPSLGTHPPPTRPQSPHDSPQEQRDAAAKPRRRRRSSPA